MAKRLFFQTKLYDYSTLQEAENHRIEMESKGWYAKNPDDRPGVIRYIFTNGQDSYPYSVEYYKER